MPEVQTLWDFICDLEVAFESEGNASIVHEALLVDKELQPDKVKRQMSISGGKLSVHFEAVFELLFLPTLATKTIEQLREGKMH